MNELLAGILDAHGGMDRWRGYEQVEATIVSGGGFFALKGVLQSEAFRAAHHKAGDNKPLYLEHPQFEGFEVRQTVRRAI
jgi:hypothetical protein